MRGQRPDHTLEPTALVHEAYVKLLGRTEVAWRDRAHFQAVAARAMRQILTDHERARRTRKRGGDARRRKVRELASPSGVSPLDLLALDEALEGLAEREPKKAQVVELRFFGGLTTEEAAEVLRVTTRTLENDWRYAKTWLRRELNRGIPESRRER